MEFSEQVYSSIARVYDSSIVIYHYPENQVQRSKRQIDNEENLTRGEYNGYMSPKTKSKVKKYLSTWLGAIKEVRKNPHKNNLTFMPYPTFITLTLPSPQQHSDNEIKRKCLDPYIKKMIKKHNTRNYFWRAESQKNGNIHFHIIVDTAIHHKLVRQEWNAVIGKLGYLDNFEKKHGHRNPNSTDIHALRRIDSVENYVIKYCCKSDGYRGIKGRIHGCSDAIRDLQPYEIVVDSTTSETLNKIINSTGVKMFNGDGFTVIYGQLLHNKVMKSSLMTVNRRKHLIDTGLFLYGKNQESEKECLKTTKIKIEIPESIEFIQSKIKYRKAVGSYRVDF